MLGSTNTEDQYGASQDAWASFVQLGLTRDLLPVVSDPTVTISPDSKMGDVGKTPSVINFRGHAAGFPKWTKHRATERDIAKWSLETRYGICIQTGREPGTMCAIDIDIPDPVKAREIKALIEQVLPGAFFPERCRDGTGKTLLAFLYDGLLTKRVIKVAGGIIEFLGKASSSLPRARTRMGRDTNGATSPRPVQGCRCLRSTSLRQSSMRSRSERWSPRLSPGCTARRGRSSRA